VIAPGCLDEGWLRGAWQHRALGPALGDSLPRSRRLETPSVLPRRGGAEPTVSPCRRV